MLVGRAEAVGRRVRVKRVRKRMRVRRVLVTIVAFFSLIFRSEVGWDG